VPEDNSSPNRPSKPNALVTAARYSEIGFVIPAAIFLGYGLGRLGDCWLRRDDPHGLGAVARQTGLVTPNERQSPNAA
jgi:hypothetical protein